MEFPSPARIQEKKDQERLRPKLQEIEDLLTKTDKYPVAVYFGADDKLDQDDIQAITSILESNGWEVEVDQWQDDGEGKWVPKFIIKPVGAD